MRVKQRVWGPTKEEVVFAVGFFVGVIAIPFVGFARFLRGKFTCIPKA